MASAYEKDLDGCRRVLSGGLRSRLTTPGLWGQRVSTDVGWYSLGSGRGSGLVPYIRTRPPSPGDRLGRTPRFSVRGGPEVP